MYVIKDKKTGLYARHTGETNDDGYYVEYPWEMVSNINQAQEYETHLYASDVAFWHLDYMREWLIVNKETDEESQPKRVKY